MSALDEVAPGVHVATSRVMMTTSTVLAGDRATFLVDPAWLPDELEAIATAVAEGERWVTGGFATHAHHDHLLWHPAFGDAPRWASAETAARAAAQRTTLAARLGTGFPRELVDLLGRVRGITGSIPTDSLPHGFDVDLIVHDGHAPGHTALWLPRQHVLIAGDMLSDVELPLPFEPDDLGSYAEALDRLAPYAAAATVVIPGHGHVGHDATRRLDADRRYLDDVTRGGRSDDPRITNPGMAKEHAHMLRLASERGGEH